jgi:ketosteroid isomerase-like protein
MTGKSDHEQAEDIVLRLTAAMNDHDVDKLVECFSPSYRSEQPVHPNRSFGGFDQVRKNWSQMFAEVPDMRAEVRNQALSGSTVWLEWIWKGSRASGSVFEMTGVTIMDIRDGEIEWARLYMEPVEEDSPGIDQAVRELSKGSDS